VNGKFKRTVYLNVFIMNVYTVTFDHFNVSLLNKTMMDGWMDGDREI